jgi:hypothetical protein
MKDSFLALNLNSKNKEKLPLQRSKKNSVRSNNVKNRKSFSNIPFPHYDLEQNPSSYSMRMKII